jgi:hypothetical protein
MTFPAGLTAIEVTGLHLLDLAGNPASGYVTFTASGPVASPAAGAVVLGSADAQVSEGVMTPLTLPTTDAVSPAFTYTIYLRLQGEDADPPPWTGISIPSTLGASVDLSALL